MTSPFFLFLFHNGCHLRPTAGNFWIRCNRLIEKFVIRIMMRVEIVENVGLLLDQCAQLGDGV